MELTFGLKTTPMHLDYADIQRVWLEADELPEFRDAWLWDHFLPLAGPKDGQILEGWTLLAALAAQTRRLRFGLLVTSNRIRPPAVLGKIASTLDVISGGRLVMGLGAGGTHQPGDNPAVAEYAAYGLDLVPPGEGVERLRETIAILRGMWTQDVFDFHGRYYTLEQNRNEPKPIQRPGPPLLIGGFGDRMLRLIAEHADIWNVPGPPHNDFGFLAERSRRLDAECARIDRDPHDLTRSLQLIVQYDDPAASRSVVRRSIDLGFNHIVLALPRPYPDHPARWLRDEIVKPVLEVNPSTSGHVNL
ncbi:alkanesulfonate monooxygenase SsuD/methylene tetrahydromethanopterin reductase-like flavin-dependent oxidoreductase (luciferase family) [Kribbella antiqua]|uniref:Alkanesulfonate monooxygenase SsuD/methylene tetrahydromethanopterin reductase-like flavin-dependent oxidoreductase (Luciferase family) n=1 Tax=Kribbella antiqua TaxID=2512217 RepID=A0A4R2I782_9ACTN|nr:LLM class flavin-dependent oxidoreductase [Kribbella antiqua]TCO40144.1 alkanesulfonate monooxygenase SsuD/methylene tetrahydromethanopterin reductase-like flavin-dependent oxidoreductase (luciferase family) [Kribbella antiqua]